MLKKILCYTLVLTVSTCFLTSCSNKKEEKSNVAVTIGDTEIEKEEAIWYVYLMVSDLYDDAVSYEKDNNSSYWDLYVDDAKANTVADSVKSSSIKLLAEYEIYSNELKRSDKFELDDSAIEALDEETETATKDISDKLEKMGLTKEGYRKYIEKKTYATYYYNQALDLYDVDTDELKEEHPYSKDEYASQDEYDAYINELVTQEKQEKFEDEYSTLESMYGITINYDVWDTVSVKAIAAAIKESKEK